MCRIAIGKGSVLLYLAPSVLRNYKMFRTVASLAFLLMAGCDKAEMPPRPGGAPVLDVALDPPLLLDDGENGILVHPTRISQDRVGRYYISDSSDRDIKVYDSAGRRHATVGRAGQGPGEFVFLRHAFVQDDSLVAYDLGTTRLQVFAPTLGPPARSLTVRLRDGGPPIRVLGADSLFLLTRASLPPTRADLLELWTTGGRSITSFFNRWDLLGNSHYAHQFSQVQSDAHAGIVFAAFSFTDSVYAFDYRGASRGSGPIDQLIPLQRLETVAPTADETRGQSMRTLMSRLDGDRWLKRIVALPGGLVAMQVAVYRVDTAGMLEGGTIIVGYLGEGGSIRNVLRIDTDAELMGRDAIGSPLLLRYANQGYDAYELIRMRLSEY